MLATSKSLSLIEQKRLQWAKEREEMVGLCGLWGRPKQSGSEILGQKNNLLPPIQGRDFEDSTKERYRPEEESETSGYLSDSPKHLTEGNVEYSQKESDVLNNDAPREDVHQQYWSEADKSQNYWSEKKMYKNYKNENWAHQNTEYVRNNPRVYPCNKNYWYGTPESASSDDGCRLRWGDRGVGIGHLWEPVINHPDSRLPQVANSYGQTPKWVEKGLKNAEGNKADILIIHHPDDEQYDHPQKNYILGQNAPIPPEVIEEREKKRKKALEHQNAIKKQLEERELKRKQEKENRIREERLEEERIKKEQEIERMRYEEEQRRIKQKEEIEKRKEEAMREAIEEAERRAKEEKKRNKRNVKEVNITIEKVEKLPEQSERSNKRHICTPRYKKAEDKRPESGHWIKKEPKEKKLKDSSSQFEEIQLANNFQFLNMNGLPMDGGLALMLDNPPKENFLLPPEGMQLALLMSPRNTSSTNHLIPASPPTTALISTAERTLTPSKYRITERLRYNPSNKSTQTDFKFSSNWIKPGSAGRGRRQSRRCGTNSGSSGGSQKCGTIERHHKHVRCFVTSKHRSKHSTKSLEDRPKWGINRPSVQYKKQSEKDPYYQKKIKERLKRAAEMENLSDQTLKNEEAIERVEEKELPSIVRMLDCQTDEDKTPKRKDVLRNGYRMNSNLSSPVFVPISSGLPSGWKKSSNIGNESERSRSNDSMSNEDVVEEEETAVPGSVGFLTQTQLDAIKQITNLREGLKRLQKDYSNSRSVTPFSDKSSEK